MKSMQWEQNITAGEHQGSQLLVMGAVLDMVEYFFFNGKKKQINRPERNHSVDWLDLWQKNQELLE